MLKQECASTCKSSFFSESQLLIGSAACYRIFLHTSTLLLKYQIKAEADSALLLELLGQWQSVNFGPLDSIWILEVIYR